MEKLGWRLLLFLCLTAAPAAFGQSTRHAIAFVDFEQVFTNYYKTKLANDQLSEMSDTMNREQAKLLLEFDVLEKEFKELRDKVIAESSTETKEASRKAMDAKLVELRRHEDKIRYFNETQQKRWDAQNARIRSELIEEIREKIRVFGKARGFHAMVDKNQVNERGVPAVLYFDPEYDVTLQVIDHINNY